MILDGRKIADEILLRIRERVDKEKLSLKLSVVLVGDNKVSLSYISQKKESCIKAGVDFNLFQFNGDISQDDLKKEIEEINKKSSGVIIQLPLPSSLKSQEVLNMIPKEKDIDILSEDRLGKYYAGDFYFLPPVVGAVAHVISKEKISLKDKYIVLVGSGKLVGKPLSIWLMAEGATISVLNKGTKDLESFIKKADIIISGAGSSNLIKGEMIKDGVIAIDAGSSIEVSRVSGDFENKTVAKKASLFLPVPGGIGPITTACLIDNLIKLNELYGN